MVKEKNNTHQKINFLTRIEALIELNASIFGPEKYFLKVMPINCHFWAFNLGPQKQSFNNNEV